MTPLAEIPGTQYSRARAASSDGTVIVGRADVLVDQNLRSAAAIWDNRCGMRFLEEVLVNDCGLNLTGWDLQEAVDISDDGFVIVGRGRNPAGYMEAWMAIIPEPATLSLLAVGGLAVLRRRKK